MATEKGIIVAALIAVVLNAIVNLYAPHLIAHVVDTFLPTKNYHQVLVYSGVILSLYVFGLVTSYAQTRLMGGVGQRVLYRLRNAVFTKLQELPVAFFSANKAGDLISRINNDTDKINIFFSQSLVQFMGSIFLMIGAAVFLLSIHFTLGGAVLLPAVALFFFTRIISPWVKRKNLTSMQSLGGMSAEIQESLNNFKVIIAFNRRDYFRKRFQEVNDQNYTASIGAGLANNTLTPIYGLAANLGQLVLLSYGIYLISTGNFTIGLLVSFLSYVNNFYNPLRQLAALWASFQQAMASWERVHEILSLDTNMTTVTGVQGALTASSLLEFQNVHFKYVEDGAEVLHGIHLKLEQGKTYALVGPTGGGKTTTASLMARLYDPTEGVVLLNGKDIRTVDADERTKKIGFILQDPILFTGTVRENIAYGNEQYKDHTNEELEKVIHEAGLDGLLGRFDEGLETKITATGDSISLGQKQLIAFMRAVLRKPELLILDEATANIDTVTEDLLQGILDKLPTTTTRVIIAHRLNTIANADEIFFVNSGSLVPAGSMEHAVDMLLRGKRES
jgi:ATP-binding cassette subfamily B protein